MKIILIFFISILCIYDLYSQKKSENNFLPSNKDNKWLFIYDNYAPGRFVSYHAIIIKEVIADTIINGNRYCKFNMPTGYFQRYDAIENKILVRGEDSDYVFMDFNLEDGEEFEQLMNSFIPAINYPTIISENFNLTNIQFKLKGFHTRNMYMGYNKYLYANNIGDAKFYEMYSAGFHNIGSSTLVEAIVITEDSTYIYDDLNSPIIQVDPPIFIDYPQIILNLKVGHKYTRHAEGGDGSGTSRRFIDTVVLNSRYQNNDSIIPNHPIQASLLSNHKDDYRISVSLDTNLVNNGYVYHYKIIAKDKGLIPNYSSSPDTGWHTLIFDPTSNSETIENFSFNLYQNYPNPFNPTTKIKYSIPQSQNPLPGGARGGLVTLKVYDVLGNEVATLVNEEKSPGVYEVEFDALNLSSGIYFYQIKSGNFIQTNKMILMK